MSSFIFAVNAVLPIILTVSVGFILKRIGLMSADFSKMANKLVFRVFLPAMLFLNVYKIMNISGIELGYIIFVLLAALSVFLISIPAVMLVTKSQKRRGALLQSTFRSNFALIGIPLAESLFGSEGVIVATLLSAAIIPLYNILAVISLSAFSDDKQKNNIAKILNGIVKNPLIQSIFIGLLSLVIRYFFERYGVDFRLSDTPIYTAVEYLSKMATPLALLVLGAQFEFSAIKELKKEILFGTLMRTVAVPTVCISVAYLFFSSKFTGAHFATFVAVFATPVAVSSVPMAQEMKSDATLAGQLVVWTTLVSAFTVFIFTFSLKSLGII